MYVLCAGERQSRLSTLVGLLLPCTRISALANRPPQARNHRHARRGRSPRRRARQSRRVRIGDASVSSHLWGRHVQGWDAITTTLGPLNPRLFHLHLVQSVRFGWPLDHDGSRSEFDVRAEIVGNGLGRVEPSGRRKELVQGDGAAAYDADVVGIAASETSRATVQ
jgi:hypothetical protein